jgi:hypothetical protein
MSTRRTQLAGPRIPNRQSPIPNRSPRPRRLALFSTAPPFSAQKPGKLGLFGAASTRLTRISHPAPRISNPRAQPKPRRCSQKRQIGFVSHSVHTMRAGRPGLGPAIRGWAIGARETINYPLSILNPEAILFLAQYVVYISYQAAAARQRKCPGIALSWRGANRRGHRPTSRRRTNELILGGRRDADGGRQAQLCHGITYLPQ